tara:strand:+ start:2961 stop:3410 length:450 start_codon:yes stop_codon:yes gene_type:complete
MINNITNEITEARPYWQNISLKYNMWKRYPAGNEFLFGGGGGSNPNVVPIGLGKGIRPTSKTQYVASKVPMGVIKAELGNQAANLALTGEFGPSLPEGLLGFIDYFNPLTGGQINPINQAYTTEQPIMGGEENDWGTNWDITPSNEASW